MTRVLLHVVGNADFGASVRDIALRNERIAELATLPDELLRDRLSCLQWAGDVTGSRSPLSEVAGHLSGQDDVVLLLVHTEYTRAVAVALRDALARRDDLYGARFTQVHLVGVGAPGDARGGLAESVVVAALPQVLAGFERAWVTWGSGSTQLVFGTIEAATVAGVPWTLLAVNERTGFLGELAPQLTVDGWDPVVALLRRWRCHDELAALAVPLGLGDEQRRVIEADAAARRAAYTAPTPSGLRLLVSDALVKQDITSAFTIRRYVLARYHELRTADPTNPADLVQAAEHALRHSRNTGHPTLGRIIAWVHKHRTNNRFRASVASPSGQWLCSDQAKAFNDAGTRTHRLLAPTRAQTDRIRRHFDNLTDTAGDASGDPTGATMRARVGDTAGDIAGLPPVNGAPPIGAWYLRIMGPQVDPSTFDAIARDGVDQPVADYFGAARQHVPRRFLLLGGTTESVAAAQRTAPMLAACAADNTTPHHISDPPGGSPGDLPGGSPGDSLGGIVVDWADISDRWNESAAESLLTELFQPIRSMIGAIVLLPTGRKETLLPLLTAANTLARRNGMPLYLLHLNEPGVMHRLPVRYGALADLLDIAANRLAALELDLATRLLDACPDQQHLAGSARRLTDLVFCRGATVPTLDLLSQRLDLWARLAEQTPDDVSVLSRALFGACASIEHSGRRAGLDNTWQQATTTVPLFDIVREVRDRLPTSHGTATDIDTLARATAASHGITTHRITAATLLRLTATAANRWPFTGATQPSLSTQLTELRDSIMRCAAAERDRQRHHNLVTGRRILTDLVSSNSTTDSDTDD